MLDILWHHFAYEHEMQHVHIHAKCLPKLFTHGPFVIRYQESSSRPEMMVGESTSVLVLMMESREV